MDRIDAMRAFTTAVDRGSLAAAARRLGYSAAKVTRGIAMLEGRLRLRLLLAFKWGINTRHFLCILSLRPLRRLPLSLQ